jgi:hypothetical protein
MKKVNDRINWYQEFITAAGNKGSNPEEAERNVKGAMRYLCQNDLFYLMVYGLDRKDIINPWLFDRCMEIQREPNDHLDLWARNFINLRSLPMVRQSKTSSVILK